MFQCPYSGGPAVYEARAMLIPLNGTASYNDHQICFNDSIAWKKPSQITSYNVSVQPSHPTYQPPSISPSSGWFVPNSNAELDCISDFSCNALRPSCDLEITDFDRVVADHFIRLAEAYPAEVRWLAERNLYNKLLNCPDLRSETLMSNFFYSFGKYDSQRFFSDLEHQLSETRHWDKVTDSLFYTYDSLTRVFTGFIESINIMIVNTHDKDSLNQLKLKLILYRQQLHQIEINRQILIDNINLSVEQLIDTLSNDNLAASYSEVYEQNESIANDIYYRTVSRGKANFSVDDKTNIIAIADQCPYSGGPAVYRARVMRKLFESKRYDDIGACSQLGIAWRKAQEDRENRIFLKAVPNPAQLFTIVRYSLRSSDDRGSLIVCNAYGSVLLKQNIISNQGEVKINTQDWDSGIYSLSLISSTGQMANFKLVIIE